LKIESFVYNTTTTTTSYLLTEIAEISVTYFQTTLVRETENISKALRILVAFLTMMVGFHRQHCHAALFWEYHPP
jgi:hypothetical protein